VSTLKFDTCRFRSAEEIQFGELSCCGSQAARGHICYERNIEGLTPTVCEKCDFYQSRLIEDALDEGYLFGEIDNQE